MYLNTHIDFISVTTFHWTLTIIMMGIGGAVETEELGAAIWCIVCVLLFCYNHYRAYKYNTEKNPNPIPNLLKAETETLGAGLTNLEISTCLKGILFVQEMYDAGKSSIENLHKELPEKYDFLFRRGNKDDTIIFQGSTAEGLAIYRIEENQNPEDWIHNLRWDRHFDYDLMSVKNKKVLHNFQYQQAMSCFMAKHSQGGQNMARALKLWKEARFCLHDKEPLLVQGIFDENDPLGMLAEHVIILQPACTTCVNSDGQLDKRFQTHDNGRIFRVKTPQQFWLQFVKDSHTRPSEDHNCDSNGGAHGNFNKHGDLCGHCIELNSVDIQHKDATTHIFLDSAFKAGPSILLQYYLDHQGKPQKGLPLFNEPGVSTVSCDNIPALQYPLLDWSHWGELLEIVGVEGLPKPLLLPWPYSCFGFTDPRNVDPPPRSRSKSKSGWPSMLLRHKVMKGGAQLVPRYPRMLGEKGPKSWLKMSLTSLTKIPAWRISFSLSEKILVKSFTQVQRRCFLLLKVLMERHGHKVYRRLEEQFGEDDEENISKNKFKVSSFLLKHVMFWTMEEVEEEEWRMNNLYDCIIKVLDKLDLFLENNSVPHFFLGPRKNLLAGDISIDVEADEKELGARCSKMKKEIGELKGLIFETLIGCLLTDHLDFQWSVSSSLCIERLRESFLALASVQQCNSLSKEAVKNHHKMMIHLIKNAPRKYGRGVNIKLLIFLQTELQTLSSDEGSLETLENTEREKVRQEIMGKETKPSDLQLKTSFLELYNVASKARLFLSLSSPVTNILKRSQI